SLTLTPMLNAYLMKRGGQKRSKMYEWTEPYFEKMNSGYAKSLKGFLNNKWLSFPILIACFMLIAYFFTTIKKETAPYDDRSRIGMNITGSEGASYDYMDRYMRELDRLVHDSVSENKVALVITSPGFGSGSVNSGRVSMTLTEPHERTRTQAEIADELTQWTRAYTGVKVSVSQQPTISVGRRGGMPIQYIIQAQNFEKLREKIPLFMEEINNDPTFSNTDVNLKFNKPEINVTIDRAKAQSLGIS